MPIPKTRRIRTERSIAKQKAADVVVAEAFDALDNAGDGRKFMSLIMDAVTPRVQAEAEALMTLAKRYAKK